ncbi:STAS domain-containing protein [Geobacter pelophilus]|uniref:STAS domain-containing protein n=1 Tax=Geoanaerobacter pelophilus TaxID=60036 RepID=A0AAW4L482_9BACT|nr:STAS domain-containing protein [Geoanaerobacter pelophilus]MBT0665698.1 STAS domain-containing protein [Geoanaerobacter pelophilus]
MIISMEGPVVYLKGDWTINGVTKGKIDSLACALQHISESLDTGLLVDCSHITSIDTTGHQLIYIWVQCARLRGMEPELVNLPDSLRQRLQNLGECYGHRRTFPKAVGENMSSCLNSSFFKCQQL